MMRRSTLLFSALAAVTVVAAGTLQSLAATDDAPEIPRVALPSPSQFGKITDQKERAIALFKAAAPVIQHPRCMNCHPAGDRPLQGETMHPHRMNIVRGDDNLGAIGARCHSCHRKDNFEPAGVPGHPLWHLAPIEMAWAGKSLSEICEQIKDPKRNGGKTVSEIVTHMAEDTLVGWAWNPGGDRVPAPGTQAEFGALFKAWEAAGATCPAP